MRIAVINRVFARTGGGAESYSVALVEALAVRHEVHVFAQETNRPVAAASYHRVFCLARKPRWVNQLLFAVASWWATRRGYDVVHSHENTWHGQVQTIHVRPTRYNLFHGRRGVQRLMRWLKVVLSPRLWTYVGLEGARFRPRPGRQLVATSLMLAQECELAYPASRERLSIITPGTSIPAHALPRSEARRLLGLPVEGRCLLFVANDYRRKGLDALLAALAQLPADVGLLVAGKPEGNEAYRGKAEQLGVAARVRFLGSLNDLTPAYCAADALAHPTLEDTYAMVVLEAMAHGLPVVVSGAAYCGISRDLHDGREALLLDDPHDERALAAQLRSVLETPTLAGQLRGQGLEFARAHDWAHVAAQYEALYQRAAAGRTA